MKECINCKHRMHPCVVNLANYCSDCEYIRRKIYKKTINGFIMICYRGMKRRTKGKATRSPHLYKGKSLLKKEDFYTWSKTNEDFLRLYKHWVINNYDIKLTPSINRINPKEGYTLDNMEWVTNSINCSLSGITRKNKNKEKQIIYKVAGINYEKS